MAPTVGMKRIEYLSANFWKHENAKRLHAYITKIGTKRILISSFDQIGRTPNMNLANKLKKFVGASISKL